MAWKCPRQSSGVRCGHANQGRAKKCARCGKTRPARKKAKHLVALESSYDVFLKLNGGEFCGICGRGPTPTRRLDRDHCHTTGALRGLLCPRCNQLLTPPLTVDWLERAVAYLKRSELANH